MLICFEDEAGDQVGINPEMVKLIITDEQPGFMQIQLLGEDNSIVVKGSFAEVFKTLNWSKDSILNAAVETIHAGTSARGRLSVRDGL